jgi:hypothetical protein
LARGGRFLLARVAIAQDCCPGKLPKSCNCQDFQPGRETVVKPFRILVKLGDSSEIWDALGMKAVKSFGILVKGYRGRGSLG